MQHDGAEPLVDVLVVDAANVVGSRPDGWWRDRAGAAARLVSSVEAALDRGSLDGPVEVVLEGAARAGAPIGTHGRLRVLHAERDGDTAIADRVAALATEGARVAAVTADRGLRERVLAAGGTVLGPSWLLDRL